MKTIKPGTLCRFPKGTNAIFNGCLCECKKDIIFMYVGKYKKSGKYVHKLLDLDGKIVLHRRLFDREKELSGDVEVLS